MRTATPVPSLVLPATHVLAYLAKWTLQVVFLLGVLLALARQAAAAPEVFTASGDFISETALDGAAVLSGTVTIDTATGKLLSADLMITIPGEIPLGEAVFTEIGPALAPNILTFPGMVTSGTYKGESADLHLQILGVRTLVGYSAGNLGFPYSKLEFASFTLGNWYLLRGHLAPLE